MNLRNRRQKRHLFATILLVISILISQIGISSFASNNSEIAGASTEKQYRNVAYFTSWCGYTRAVEVGNINPSLLTHINFAFANLSSDGAVTVGDPWIDTQKPYGDDTWQTELKGHFGQLNKLKTQYPHIKTLISVGGWTWSKNFSGVAANEALRKACAQSAVDFVVKYGFDGVDLDWEYPVAGGDNIPHRPDDGDNYILLLKEIRKALDVQGEKDGKNYLLSIAGAASLEFVANCKVASMMQYLDYINVMTYDYHGAWDTTTNHVTPLYDGSSASALCVADTIEEYIRAGVKPADLNLGLAFYGKGWINVKDPNGSGLYKSGSAATSAGYGSGTWEGSSFDYWDIEENYIGKNNYTRYWDDTAKMPYLYNGSTFITYDDKESLGYKMDYLMDMGLGGAMFWEFSCDKKLELQKFVANRLGIDKGEIVDDPVLPPLEIKYYGDLNEDGYVDSIDFALLKSYLLGKDSLISKEAADINVDDSIDAIDLANLKLILLENRTPQPIKPKSTVLLPSVGINAMTKATQNFYDVWKKTYIVHNPYTQIAQYYVWYSGQKYNANNPPAGEGVAVTVSEAHGYGMLVTALMADYDKGAKIIFDGLYRFYKAHPSSIGTNLMAWQQADNGKKIFDCENDGYNATNTPDSATDGDIDIAYALLLADAKWGSSGEINYKKAALAVINDIMTYEVNKKDWTLQLGSWCSTCDYNEDYYTATRCSDFIMQQIKAFAEVTGNDDWNKVIDASYSIALDIVKGSGYNTGLLPDFVIKNDDGSYGPAYENFLEAATDGDYAYNSCRTPWRIATDYIMTGDKRAKEILDMQNSWIMKSTGSNPDKVMGSYDLKGKALVDYNDTCFTLPFLLAAMCQDNSVAGAQKWVDGLWSVSSDTEAYDYYGDSIKMLTLITASGKWQKP